jgi:hypothetical protein
MEIRMENDKNTTTTKFPHEIIRDSIVTKMEEPVFIRESTIGALGLKKADMINLTNNTEKEEE